VHSHRFPGANTAVPYANQDQTQLEATEKFLTSGFISVDIFAVSPVNDSGTAMVRRTGEGPHAMTGFAVGEEAEQAGNRGDPRSGQVAAPIDHSGFILSPVPRPRGRGGAHAQDRPLLPRRHGGCVRCLAGTARQRCRRPRDLLERQVEDGGKGPVEPGAHFYRAFQLDGDGNMIDKRNAWQARSVLYVRLIPPGAADVAHYRVKIPKDAKGPLHVTAKLNYRKFSHYYTQFAYAGQPKPGPGPEAVVGQLQQHGIQLRSAQYSAGTFPAISRTAFRICPLSRGVRQSASVPLGQSAWTPVVRKRIASAGTIGASACCCRAT
jgi:hypothetical protein